MYHCLSVFAHVCTGSTGNRKGECFLQDFSSIFLPAKNWCGVLIVFGLLGPVIGPSHFRIWALISQAFLLLLVS